MKGLFLLISNFATDEFQYNMDNALVIGACGQLGSELIIRLREIYGSDHVIGSDIKNPQDDLLEGPFEIINALDKTAIQEVVKKYGITQIYHLAAILSAKAEQKPLQSWELNMQGLLNILEIGREKLVEKIFWPSSIAVFGPTTPRKNTPQYSIMDPNTVYGISKLAGERWCEYYSQHYNVDIRSLRYPGLIGYKTAPGGGTTDYAVDIYFHAAKNKPYSCFLKENTYLPLMYMDDAVNAAIQLMDAKPAQIRVRSSYNLGSFSVCPGELALSIQKIIPEFEVAYNPDYRQEIADSWPESVNDENARSDWNWKPKYDLDKMTRIMLKNLMEPAGI